MGRNSHVKVEVSACPSCDVPQEFQFEFFFGALERTTHRIGDVVLPDADPRLPPSLLVTEGSTTCTACRAGVDADVILEGWKIVAVDVPARFSWRFAALEGLSTRDDESFFDLSSYPSAHLWPRVHEQTRTLPYGWQLKHARAILSSEESAACDRAAAQSQIDWIERRADGIVEVACAYWPKADEISREERLEHIRLFYGDTWAGQAGLVALGG